MEEEPKPETHCSSLYRTPITKRFEKDDKGYLGGGSFGTVYRGYDRQKQCDIAIKCIDRNVFNKCNKDIIREISIMSDLQHPNIIQFYGYHEDSYDGLYMFLELCCPDNLNTRIIAKLKENQALKWFGQLVEGMSYINSKGTIGPR